MFENLKEYFLTFSGLEFKYSSSRWVYFMLQFILISYGFYRIYLNYIPDDELNHSVAVVYIVDHSFNAIKILFLSLKMKQIKNCLNKSLKIIFSIKKLTFIRIMSYLPIIFNISFLLVCGLVDIYIFLVTGYINVTDIPFRVIFLQLQSLKLLTIVLCYIATLSFKHINHRITQIKNLKITVHEINILMTLHWRTVDYIMNLSTTLGPLFFLEQCSTILKYNLLIRWMFENYLNGFFNVIIALAITGDFINILSSLYCLAMVNDYTGYQVSFLLSVFQIQLY